MLNFKISIDTKMYVNSIFTSILRIYSHPRMIWYEENALEQKLIKCAGI